MFVSFCRGVKNDRSAPSEIKYEMRTFTLRLNHIAMPQTVIASFRIHNWDMLNPVVHSICLYLAPVWSRSYSNIKRLEMRSPHSLHISTIFQCHKHPSPDAEYTILTCWIQSCSSLIGISHLILLFNLLLSDDQVLMFKCLGGFYK